MNNPFFLSVLSSIGFGAWPLVARVSGLPTVWVAIAVSIGSAAAILAGSSAFLSGASPSSKAILIGVIAGLMNGASTLFYSKLVSNISWDISIYGPIVTGLAILVLAVGGMLFFKEIITLQKVAGVIAILVGIYLLR